jgi:SAM-dependent methyltransferase
VSTTHVTLDWPPSDAIDSSGTYAKYAEIYDILFDHLFAETDFYVNQASDAVGANGSILELGSGTGRLTRHLLAAGHTVAAVDPSAEMLERAGPRLAEFGARYQPHHAEMSALNLDESFLLAVAPYGMVAHLLTDEDRLRTFTRVHEHLRPGGIFIFDDMPEWLGGATDSTQLHERSRGVDPASGLTVRLLCNTMEVAGQPLSVRYDIIDWLSGDKVARRAIIRVVFRNIALADELELLRHAGFGNVELFGDFSARPFNRDDPAANQRLVIKCRRA